MNVESPTPDAQAAAERDRIRSWSAICASLFVPAALAAGMLTLSSEHGTSCMMYGGQGCGPHVPPWLFPWGIGIAAVAFLAAVAAPAARVRRLALGAQIAAESAALLVILGYA